MSDNQDMTRKAVKKPALGRGLGSLLGDSAKEADPIPHMKVNQDSALKQGFVEVKTVISDPSAKADGSRVWQINIAKLAANKKQPRKVFTQDALKELAASIKEKGILQPIVARPAGDGNFEIIAGERRWRAAQAAGLHEVPVIVKASADQDALELALIENIQRENLNPIEEADAYHHLIQTYGLTQQQLADKLGKDRVTVANTLRLLGLAKTVRNMLLENTISMGHAKVLLAVADPAQQKQLADRVASKKLSVRELERQVAQMLKPVLENGSKSIDLDVSQKLMVGLSEELQKIIGSRVTIDYDHGKGKIAIQFYSDDELNGIVDRIRDTWLKSKQ